MQPIHQEVDLWTTEMTTKLNQNQKMTTKLNVEMLDNKTKKLLSHAKNDNKTKPSFSWTTEN